MDFCIQKIDSYDMENQFYKGKDSQLSVLRIGEPVPVLFDQPILKQMGDDHPPFQLDKEKQPKPTPAERRLYEKTFPSVVQIWSTKEGQNPGMGSGVVLGDLVITACHVVPFDQNHKLNTSQLNIFDANFKQLKGHVVCADEETDLAVIKLDGDRKDLPPTAQLPRFRHWHSNEALYGSGTPLAIWPMCIAPGKYLGKYRGLDLELQQMHRLPQANLPKSIEELQTDAYKKWQKERTEDGHGWYMDRHRLANMHLEHGNSGGPIFDARGKLVGIASHTYACLIDKTLQPDRCIFADDSEIRKIVRQANFTLRHY